MSLRLQRIVRLLGLLQGGPGQNAQDLAATCGISKRTLFRDLETLREAGVPVQFQDLQQRYRITGECFLPPTNFTAEEALALIILSHELGGRRGVPFYTAARSAALKLESSLPGRLREHLLETAQAVRIDLAPRGDESRALPDYQQLLQATTSRQHVRVTYRSLTEWDTIQTKLSPYRMLFSRRSWYVVGRSSLHSAVRTFNVTRILKLEPLESQFTIPPRFSLERYLRNAWHLIPEPGTDSDVQLVFEKQVAQNVSEVLWHKTQRTKFLADGRLEMTLKVSGLQEISWWILGYGDQVEVLQPVALRELICKRIRSMSQRYGL